jgi:transposase
MKFIGIDLHSDKFTVGIWDTKSETEKIILHTFYITTESLNRFYKLLDKNTYVVVEASTNAFWFHDKIADKVKECFVCLKKDKKNRKNKNDKIDTRDLTRLLAVHILTQGNKKVLETVHIPSHAAQELRALFSSRKLVVKQINQIKNRIHSLFKQNGICVTKKFLTQKGFMKKIREMEMGDVWKIQIALLYEDLQSKTTTKDKLEKLILLKGNDYFSKEITVLTSIRGVSNIIAVAIMAEVDDINRFSSAKKLCSYLRTAPRVEASNNTIKIKGTNKSSRATVVSLLTQSVLHLQNAGEYINTFYNRIKTGKKSGTVRIAVIRKILVSVYHMLKKNEKYYWKETALTSKKETELFKDIQKAQKIYEDYMINIAA